MTRRHQQLSVGSFVIVTRGRYKNRIRCRVYSLIRSKQSGKIITVFITLPNGCGVQTSRSNVRLAVAQKESKEEHIKRLKADLISSPSVGGMTEKLRSQLLELAETVRWAV